MTQYSDLADLVNQFNLTGDLGGTSTVPGISLSKDANGNYIITYTHFASETELTAANYYDVGGLEAQHIVSSAAYRQDIETALENILNPTGTFSVSFSDVAQIDFQEATSGTGIVTFAQMESSFFLQIMFRQFLSDTTVQTPILLRTMATSSSISNTTHGPV